MTKKQQPPASQPNVAAPVPPPAAPETPAPQQEAQQGPAQPEPDAPAPASQEHRGDEPTLRDGVPALDLSSYPDPLNNPAPGWQRLDTGLDTGLRHLAEKIHNALPIDRVTVDVFKSVECPDVCGVVYGVKRATGVELFITRKHLEQLNADFRRFHEVKATKLERVAEARAEAQSLAEPAAEPSP
jgi:hypothetical protein